GYFKDGINDFVVRARADAVNPEATGTKAAAHYRFLIAGGGSVRLRLRLRPEQAASGLDDFDDILACRRAEADEFYEALQADVPDADARLVQRQALACSGQSSSIVSIFRSGFAATRCSRIPPRAAGTAATPSGGISTMPTSCRCRTNGNTPGTRPGISPFTASR